ncbi:branched-chain amino acid transport system substrate-binding protein [Pseudoduganella flava]|uniref:ABC transporter substrate-binding protein n=1 Tax=Pseudoduganella flava TaxID=871742 RepID=A0A562PN85_9BURK|nr:ABC transporter substrate-binding protein [Pseudoduganella flava]QGZ40488.1 ABC transporter substrate-binding protein [Pseudoduganella flava]TWI45931.1 branched-chain amino acid transport system substrate-binding protein [Pseudoduganella flava]
MKLLHSLVLGTVLAAGAAAQAQEQFVALPSYRVGPYASGGSGFYGGIIDYFQLVNQAGGVNGVKIAWEECETEYNPSRGVECYERLKTSHGGATLVEPLSTSIAYGILDRIPQDKIPMTMIGYGRSDAANGKVFPYVFPLISSYWSQAAAMVKYLADKNGGSLKGKKIVHLYHDSAFGKEPLPVLEALAKQQGFELVKIPVAPPGSEQQAQWLQIRQARPDHVILWGWGVMNSVAIKTAQRNGFPREKILGVWWAGSEEDTVPSGDAAKGYTAMSFNTPGNYPVLDEIRSKVYGAGKGNLGSQARIGSVYHMRGVTAGILFAEAIRTAQEKFGKDKPVTGEQMRWGLEHLNIDAARQKAIGAVNMFPTVKTSCEDHEGSGAVKVQQWDGKKWVAITPNWIVGDRALVRKLVEESSNKYAAEKNIKPACLP